MQSPSTKPAHSLGQSTSEIPPMYSPAQMRQLKVAVIAMGVILLLGFAVVIGRIVYLVNSGPRPAATAAAPTGAHGGAAPASLAQLPQAQAGAALSLPKGAVVRQMALSGNRLAVYYEGPDGAGVRIVDLATGGAGLTLPIVPEAERRP